MSVRSCLFLGLFVFASAGSAANLSYAQSESADVSSSYMVLAQNESGKKRSFFGNVFNRSDKKSSAKPLFLDKPDASVGGRSKIKPFNYSTRKRGSSSYSSGKVSWAAFEKARAAETADGTKRALQAGVNATMEVDREINLMLMESASKGGNARNISRKKMVYDPQKARSYDPNKPRNSEKRSRIFNSR